MPATTSTTWLWFCVIGLAVTSGYFGWRLMQARASAAECAQIRETTIVEMKKTEQQLRHQLASPSTATATSSGSVLTRSAAGSGMPSGRLEKSIGPFRPPHLAREHRITMTRMRYTKLLQEDAFSDAELDAVLPVLSDMDQITDGTGAPPRALSDEERARFRDELDKAVGRERAEQVLQAKERAPFRMEVTFVAAQLDSLGAPLSKQQQRDLASKLFALGPSTPPLLPKPGEPPTQNILKSWQDARNDRLLTAAEGVFTPGQLQRLTEIQAMNSALSGNLAALGRNAGAAGAPAP